MGFLPGQIRMGKYQNGLQTVQVLLFRFEADPGRNQKYQVKRFTKTVHHAIIKEKRKGLWHDNHSGNCCGL